jgi:protein SCO1/2
MRAPSIFAVTLALLAGMSSTAGIAHHGAAQGVSREAAGWPVGGFALLDQDGLPFTERRLAGRWTFVLFGDTRCGTRCDAPLGALAAMYRRIARADAIRTTQVLFVSLDPERDTPEVLRRHVAAFDARFIAATGPKAALHRLMDELDATGPGVLVLIGPDSVVRSELLPPYDPLLLTSEYIRTRSRR